eukprot:TRINITY_DN2656_c0_g1_i1.p1 TRINITY_DN2656_c0_g1~~TRINITY_DN2656_c0_g1_i1.p1  ORF type:complete len:354 (-),score=56.48 TRINITY_DN2656_c0_g1_i1:513-1466(-)
MVGVVGIFIGVSTFWLIITKYLLEYTFPFPLFLTWFQAIVNVGCMIGMSHVSKQFNTKSIVTPFQFNIEVLTKILPISSTFVAMTLFNNLSVSLLSVGLYQVIRSLSMATSVGLIYHLFGHLPSEKIKQCIVALVVGALFAIIGENNLSWWGLLCGLISCALVSAYGIYIPKLRGTLNIDQWHFLIYNNIFTVLTLLPVMLITGEIGKMRNFGVSFFTWIVLILSGVFFFSITIAVFLQLKFISPTINNISGITRTCLQIFFGLLIFKEPLSVFSFLGMVTVVIGSFMYTTLRLEEVGHSNSNEVKLNSVIVEQNQR